MKNILALAILALTFGCNSDQPYETKTITENGYTYETVVGDPMKTRIYTLENGLKVYLSDYKNEPRTQVYIAVNAGGKNDPAENTGLAHYLEHMMFKGTEDFGTLDFKTEKVYLDSIEHMFEYYGKLTDSLERKEYYRLIDQVSNKAAEYAIPNEYDKMVAAMGAKGTNAYTSKDVTVYINDVPSNELERYLELEGNRFKTITNRLFHTELEAVYEEKNRNLDSDSRKMQEAIFQSVFQKHTYGTQLNIGTIEHLKNPSITAIKKFFDTYYKPNNVAICISGDLNYTSTIQCIDKYFGDWKPNENLPAWEITQEDPIKEPVVKEVFGPSEERLYFAYRFPGFGSEANRYVTMIDMILSNSVAGLIDLNLNQNQKVLNAGCGSWQMDDYTMHLFYGTPKQGQSLDDVKELLLSQIELVKKGEFEDWLIPAVIADFKKSKMKELENNSSRAGNMVEAFDNQMTWADYLLELDRIEKLTKEEIVEFAKANYGDNYGIVYKRMGEDPNKQKVVKPEITKLPINKEARSEFHKMLLTKEAKKLQPVFVNYKNDLSKTEVNGIEILSKVNDENELFSLIYLLDIGSNEELKLAQAVQYMEYIGTNELSAEDFKKELYKLGCDFSVSSADEQTYVVLSGLDENMEAGTQLFEKIFKNPAADQDALDNLIDRKLQARSNAKKDKGTILANGLFSYAKYGPKSPFTHTLSNSELKRLNAEELIDMIKMIPALPHRVLYYGPRSQAELSAFISQNHNIPDSFRTLPEKAVFEEMKIEEPKVFWTDYDMVQSEVIMVNMSQKYNPSIEPEVHLFNEYFGDIVFQEIREAQGLAYAVSSSYSQKMDKSKSEYLFAYIGSQADKQPEAMKAMVNLLNDLPESESRFQIAKEAILSKIESERITRSSVIWNYLTAEKAGLDYDIRKDIYEQVNTMTFADLKAFHEEHIKGKTFTTVMIGSRDKINFEDLKKYGDVTELSLDEIFGYEDTENVNLN